MGRTARLAVLCALLLGGLTSGLLAAPGRPAESTTTVPATPPATVVPAPTTTAAPSTTAPAQTTHTTTTSTAKVVLAFSGHGWGHGLGLSQWGAYGYARHGWTYDRILAHYYTGTTLGPAHVSTVRVLVAEGRRTVLESSVDWSVTDGAGTKLALAAGTPLTLTPALLVQGARLQPPLAFASSKPLVVDGHAYRGRLTATVDGKQLQLVDVVGLEAYLKGVVPAEMPSDWPAEALKAQAVAARSYALANLQKGGAFDLYGDGRSQVYGGVSAESPAASAAVDATRGTAVLYGGKAADTVFFSSSGGRTATAADETGRPVPYLVSVVDPYDDSSPHHDWGPVLVNASRLAKLLKLPGDVIDLQPTLGSDGRVRRLAIVGSLGTQATITGAQARVDLDLRSTWFTAALLSVTNPGKAMVYGGAATLAGVVRGADGVTLESRVGRGAWEPVGPVAPAAGGAFSTIVRPQATTTYRLAWGTIRASLAKVPVAPLVRATVDAAGVSGSIRPALAGAVQLQRQDPDSSAWATVAAGTTDANGGFALSGALAPGSYRLRAAPGHGLAPGLSAPVQVP